MYLYLPKDTPVHHLHPVTKILGTILLFVPPLATVDPVEMLIPTGIVGVIAVVGKCLPNIRRVGGFILKLGVFSFLLWTMFAGGEYPVFHIGVLTVTREALLYGVAMAIRLNLLLLIGIVFLSVTRIEEVTAGLQMLGMPFRVSFALSFAFRLVPLLFDAGATVVQAQRARGMDFESGGIVERVRRYAPLLIPMILSTIRGTDLTAMALEARGFGAGHKRTSYVAFRWRGRDTVILGTLVVIDTLCLIILFDKALLD
jgi:energy-coupling factor transport system permease protein